MSEPTMQYILDRLEHYEAVDQRNHHVEGDLKDMPWESVIRLEGGVSRCGIDVAMWFTASVRGHTFRWRVELEEEGANGQYGPRLSLKSIQDLNILINARCSKEICKKFADFFVGAQNGIESYRKESLDYVAGLDKQLAVIKSIR